MLRSIAGLSATERQTEQNETPPEGCGLRPSRRLTTSVRRRPTPALVSLQVDGDPRFHKQGGRCFYLKHELDDYRAERAS